MSCKNVGSIHTQVEYRYLKILHKNSHKEYELCYIPPLEVTPIHSGHHIYQSPVDSVISLRHSVNSGLCFRKALWHRTLNIINLCNIMPALLTNLYKRSDRGKRVNDQR